MYEVTDSKGKWLANAPQSSRKDARDAVVAARKAFGGWSGATAYNRGQILYRIAEMLEGRKDQFTREVADAEGLSKAKAAAVVDAAIDRWVWYAGWTDKIAQVVGGANPVAGPYFNLSSPSRRAWSPSWPPGILVPRPDLGDRPGDRDRQHGHRRRQREVPAPRPVVGRGPGHLRPARRSGQHPLRRDGGDRDPLAAHQDVNAIDLAGADDVLAKDLEIAAADNLKRVFRPQPVDYAETPGIDRLTAFLETKTVWHPTGSLGAGGSSY